jgi:microcystin-dependent protein
MFNNNRNTPAIIASLIKKNGFSSVSYNGTINVGSNDSTDIHFYENSTFDGPITGRSTLYISGTTRLSGNVTAHSDLTVLGDFNAERVKQAHVPIGSYSLLVPTGTVVTFAGSVAPGGWLICNGDAVSRTTYQILYDVIGTIYGVGNGLTTFNLPDLRGRSALGAGQGSGLSNRPLATTGGNESHTLTTSELPAHTHTYNDAYFAENNGSGGNFGTNGSTDNDNNFYYRTASGGWSTTPADLNTGSTGSGSSFDIVQPYLALNYIIKF